MSDLLRGEGDARLPYPSYVVADYQMPVLDAIAWTCPACAGRVAMSASLFICDACRLQIPNYPVPRG